MHTLDYILFQAYPYLAGTVFLLGSLVRYDMSQYTWKTNSSQLLDNSPRFRLGSYLFHFGVIFLFFGHLIGLLTPHWLYSPFISAGAKQAMAMTTGGIAGVAAIVGGGILLHRRLTNRLVRAQSLRGDIFILILLYVQLVFGLLTIPISGQHMDGSEMMRLANWAQHIVTFRPGAAEYLADVSWIFKIHLFLGVTVFLAFPFTRLVHIWSVPYRYVARRYQMVRGHGSRHSRTPEA